MTVDHIPAAETPPSADSPQPAPPSRPPHLRRWLLLGGLLAIPLSIALASWALTPDLQPPAPEKSRALAQPDAHLLEQAEQEVGSITWPDSPLDGTPAKKLLLRSLLAARDRLEAVSGYTATLLRQERIDGKLGPEQTIAIKVRHNPFAIYMRFLKPDSGKEVVYAEGRYDNDVIAHPGGFSRALLPRLKVPPDSRLALAGNRHPVTEAGLLNLTNKLIAFRRLDLRDPEAQTLLDRTTDADGRTWLRSIHTHPHRNPERPFEYIEILYDPETKIPVRISSYDWREPGDTGDLKLAERYAYKDLNLDAPLTELDFDPANPDYEFKRF